MCCIHLILTKFILVRYTNLFDFWFDKRRRYVKGMETKLEYLFDSGTTLNMLEIQKFKKKELVKWGFSFKNTLVNIEPTQHCCLGNDIFSVCLINQNLRNCPSSFFIHDFSGITGNFEQKKIVRIIKKLIQFSYFLL